MLLYLFLYTFPTSILVLFEMVRARLVARFICPFHYCFECFIIHHEPILVTYVIPL